MSRVGDFRLLRRFLPFVTPHWKLLAISGCLLPVLAGVQLVTPYLVKLAIDDHIAVGQLAGLGRVAWLYLAAVGVTFLAMAGNHYVMQLTGQQVTYAIRTALFAHVQQLDAAFFDRTPIGRVITRLTGDVEAIGELFDLLVAPFAHQFDDRGAVACTGHSVPRPTFELDVHEPPEDTLTSHLDGSERLAIHPDELNPLVVVADEVASTPADRRR